MKCTCKPGYVKCADGISCASSADKCPLPGINLTVEKNPVRVGDKQTAYLVSPFGVALSNVEVKVRTPAGQNLQLVSDEEGKINFEVNEQGKYSLEASVGEITGQKEFNALDLPSLIIMSLMNWQALLLLILSALAALLVFIGSKDYFEQKGVILSPEQKQRNLHIRFGLEALAFLLPLIMWQLVSLSFGILFAVLEIAGLLVIYIASNLHLIK